MSNRRKKKRRNTTTVTANPPAGPITINANKPAQANDQWHRTKATIADAIKLYTDYKRIWQCANKSGQLGRITRLVTSKLKHYGIPYGADPAGNIFAGQFDKARPCLVAHLDSVHTKRPRNLTLIGMTLSSSSGLGADDKAGIVAVLRTLKTSKVPVNAIFTADEEIGGQGARRIDANALRHVQYFIEIDRRGDSDVIIESGWTELASDVFIDALRPVVDASSFRFSRDGVYSDVNELVQIAKKCAINLSAGYYQAHTPTEYVRLEELLYTIQLVKAICEDVTDAYEWTESYTAIGTHGPGWFVPDGWAPDAWVADARTTTLTDLTDELEAIVMGRMDADIITADDYLDRYEDALYQLVHKAYYA
jgi:hypothetical protein